VLRKVPVGTFHGGTNDEIRVPGVTCQGRRPRTVAAGPVRPRAGFAGCRGKAGEACPLPGPWWSRWLSGFSRCQRNRRRRLQYLRLLRRRLLTADVDQRLGFRPDDSRSRAAARGGAHLQRTQEYVARGEPLWFPGRHYPPRTAQPDLAGIVATHTPRSRTGSPVPGATRLDHTSTRGPAFPSRPGVLRRPAPRRALPGNPCPGDRAGRRCRHPASHLPDGRWPESAGRRAEEADAPPDGKTADRRRHSAGRTGHAPGGDRRHRDGVGRDRGHRPSRLGDRQRPSSGNLRSAARRASGPGLRRQGSTVSTASFRSRTGSGERTGDSPLGHGDSRRCDCARSIFPTAERASIGSMCSTGLARQGFLPSAASTRR
jgi:hypothetical protein